MQSLHELPLELAAIKLDCAADGRAGAERRLPAPYHRREARPRSRLRRVKPLRGVATVGSPLVTEEKEEDDERSPPASAALLMSASLPATPAVGMEMGVGMGVEMEVGGRRSRRGLRIRSSCGLDRRSGGGGEW